MYGHSVVKMPHLSALAESGVVFENTYCNSPLCSPSRFSMMAGQLPARINAYDNAAEFAAYIPTFAHYLRYLGYHTILSGKMHFVGPDQLHGFEERLTTDIYPSDFAWTPDWAHPERILEWYHNMSSVVTAGECVTSVDLDFDEEVAYAATRKLHQLARSGDGRPFCLVASFGHPHDPYIMPRAYWQKYPDAEIDPPKVGAIPLDRQDAHSRRLLHSFAIDEYEITEAHIRDARHGYYAALSYVDDIVGRLQTVLRETGFADNTIILFTSDHGDMLGERGLWYKMNFFEWSARVPLIVHAPGRFAARRVAAPVSLVDLLPTFVDWATDGKNTDWAVPIDGRSLNPLLTGAAASPSRSVYGEYLAEGAIAPILMIRRDQYKYVCSEFDPEMLYDLKADPDELNNLAAAPAHAELIAGFRAEAVAHWDAAKLRGTILANQQQRHLTALALMKGRVTPWDYTPLSDASQQYIRNTKELWELYKQARYPTIEPPKPRYAVQRHVKLPGQ
jgi:choline-sulfatase